MADASNGIFPMHFMDQQSEETFENQPLRDKSESEIVSDVTAQNIDIGEDYKLIIYGYERHKLYTIYTWFLIIATGGIFGLFCYWFPRLMLYTTHTKCLLSNASKVLIEEKYKNHTNSFHVKKIVTLNTNSNGCSDDENPLGNWNANNSENCTKKSRKTLFSVHVSRGIFRKMDSVKFFNCRKNRFFWDEEERIFTKLVGLDYQVPVSYFHQQVGLTTVEQCLRRAVYGSNKMEVPIRGFLTLLFIEVLNPFYVFQFFSFVLWYFDDYILYASTIFLITFIGIISSCVSTYFNQRALHKRVCSTDEVRIVQGSEHILVPTDRLVPGDVLVLPTQGCIMYCDAILLNGSCIANESALTGESDPIMKTPIPACDSFYDNKEHSRHTLYAGTEILQTRFYGDKHVLAVVIRTGFLTVKGSVVRSLLYPAPADYKFEKHSYKFLHVLALIASIGFVYTIITKISRGIAVSQIVLEALDLITIVVPPALPAAMTIGAVHALLRLKAKQVYCISSRAINVSGSVNCVCFDKTGTLTEEGLDMWGVIPIESGEFFNPVRDVCKLNSDSDLLHSMVTCHTLTIIRKELCGDPMDLKIFNSTSWVLEEPAANDDTKFDLIIPTIVKPATNSESFSPFQLEKEIGIVRHFTFSSNLQRMTVITRILGDSHYNVYCKGAPENIYNLCLPETVPSDFNNVLKLYTRKGYRVIAAAYRALSKSVNYRKMQRLSREEVETDLTMLGLIILENKLKPETAPVISVLKNANIRTVIVTGDNMLTAVSVARDCGIIMPDQDVITIHCVESPTPYIYYTLADVSPISSSALSPVADSKRSMEHVNINITDDIVNCGLNLSNGYLDSNCTLLPSDNSVSIPKKYVFAITGTCWSFLKQYFPDLVPYIGIRGTIFSRMNPDQKQHLVQELQDLGYVVAMCGDGANDCSALKAAHAGISLSSNESSGASQFTSKRQDIRCVLDVIRECRAALVISFTIFKFMASYSLTQFISIIILYSIDSNLTDAQFLYIDLFVIAFCALSLGHTPPFQGELSKIPPPSSLVSLAPIVSLLCQVIIIAVIQLLGFFTIRTYDWFTPYNSSDSEISYENYAVFSLSVLQYVILAIVFHKGPPYVGYICSNYFLVMCLVVISSVTTYIIICPASWVQQRMEMKLPPDLNFRFMILLFAVINLLLSFFVEFVLCDYLISSVLKRKLKQNPKWSKRYSNIERELLQRDNWPTVSNDIDHTLHNNHNKAASELFQKKRRSTFVDSLRANNLENGASYGSKPRSISVSPIDINDYGCSDSIYASMSGVFPSQATLHSDYFTPPDSYGINFIS